MKLPHSYKVYLPLLILFLVLVFIMPRSGKFNYDYKKGSTWLYETLIAQFDFPILKTQEQIQKEKENLGSSVIPYFKYDQEVLEEKLRIVDRLDFGVKEGLRAVVASSLSEIFGRGVLSDNTDGRQHDILGGNSLIYIQKDRRASKYPVSEMYNVSSARTKLLADLEAADPDTDADSLCSSLGIYDLVSTNLIFDQQTTDLVHEETIDYISPTSGVIGAGQLIVSHGEIVTAEIEQLLDSYRAEYEASLGYDGPRVFLWAGNIMLSFILVFLLFFAIYYANYRIFEEFNRYIYLLTIFCLSAIVTFCLEKADPMLLYLMPFSLFALYMLAFFKKRVVLPVYIISLLPLLIFAHNGTELFLMYLTAGVASIFLFGFFSKGWQQFITAFFVFVILSATYITFELIDGIKGFNDYNTIFYLFIGSILSVAGYPLIYLFEKIFMLVSNTRLAELCDTNNKLLRVLAHKAPGTFQHSLQVMNMADAAARSIGANVLLARAGAMYHDIGKSMNPQCFIENETSGAKYHSELSARESAREIIRHVTDGVSLAEKFKLPEVVKEFIYTHHGTTCTEYFYNKYLNEGGDPEKAEDFFYKGRKPVTKEQIIVMLCDTLEAASRSLKDYSPESVAHLVDRILKSKMEDGQFEDADISIKELNILCKVLTDYIQQIHHARVRYPRRKVKESRE